MAKNVIFETQPIQFDTYVAEMGGNVYQVSPAPFTLTVGENYVIMWDGIEYPSVAVPYDDFSPGSVVIGLGEAPVTIGYLASTDYIGFISSESGEHSVGLYHVVEEEEPEAPEEPEEPEGIVLKDRNGKDVAYYGIETVTFDTTTEGKQQVYTKGTAVEGLEIVPDFTGGDMPIAAPDGMLVKSATVKKPDTLIPENVRNGVEIGGVTGTLPVFDILENLPVALDFSGGNQPIVAPEGTAVKSAIIQRPENLLPENIAEGVDIAGIIGTLVAGGSAKVAFGMVTADKTTNFKVTHDLGVTPDMVVFVANDPYTNKRCLVSTAVSQKFKNQEGLNVGSWVVRKDSSVYANAFNLFLDGTTTQAGAASNANETEFTFAASTSVGISSGLWIAIGGLT